MKLSAPRSTPRVLALLLTLSALIAPQAAGQREQKDQITLRTDLVVVDVTVTDKDGNFIRKLKPEDFVVYDDGVERKHEYDLFSASEEASLTRPIAVVFALDVSGSITNEEINRQRFAAESFIKLLTPDSTFAVLAFNYEIRLLQDFTSDPKKIGQAFEKIGRGEGSTRLFQTIDRAVSMLKRGPRFRSGRRLRRVVIVLTDGFDNVDPPEQDPLIQHATNAEVTVYSITTPSYIAGSAPHQRSMTLLDVSRIVPMTGGKDFSADDKDFTPAFKAIAEEIRSSYTIAYYPPEKNRHDGRTHQIRIECKKSGAIVRTSRGAYKF
ncbi:MAG TPA: VWA domain-containing protein [Blastocatellia bacterium]|nr:VWA domain-containing protein [Blastocatellia bacterium]